MIEVCRAKKTGFFLSPGRGWPIRGSFLSLFVQVFVFLCYEHLTNLFGSLSLRFGGS
jgi:hypothetical protein